MPDRQSNENDAAHQHFLTFDAGGRRAALRVEDAAEILPMAWLSGAPGHPTILAGFLNLAGDPVPVLHLSRLLDAADPSVPTADETPADAHAAIILVRHGAGRYGLIVAQVHQVVVAPPGDVVALPPLAITHFAVKHDGSVVPIIDVGDLVLEQERRWIEQLRAVQQRRLENLETASEPSPPGRGQGEGESAQACFDNAAQGNPALTPTLSQGERELRNSLIAPEAAA